MEELIENIHALLAFAAIISVVYTDYTFFKFLSNDKKISKKESENLRKKSLLIWLLLFGLVVTGIYNFYEAPEYYLSSTKFLMKLGIVSIIILNGMLMNIYIHPKLTKIRFDDTKHKSFKKLAFASGAISITSWLSALILGSLEYLPIALPVAIIIYILILMIVISISWMIFDIRFFPDD